MVFPFFSVRSVGSLSSVVVYFILTIFSNSFYKQNKKVKAWSFIHAKNGNFEDQMEFRKKSTKSPC